MAWRPNDQFIEGVLDNSEPDRITGWMKFAGIKEEVAFDLEGNFHRDIRGAKIRIKGDGQLQDQAKAAKYMEGFCILQTGQAGDMTAGLPPHDYGQPNEAYFEWYGDDNGRIVLELSSDQVEILTSPIPFCESDPIDRNKQARNMAKFLCGLASDLGLPQSNVIAVGDTAAVEKAKQVLTNDKIRGMKLLPKEIREQLPPLYSQDGKGGKAVVYVKYFLGSWTWWATEGTPILDDAQNEIDFQFFGLVEGFEKELGYFNLSELEQVRGPLGLPIERDLHFQPKTLGEIAPEIFREV
jgi:hypothetical protein